MEGIVAGQREYQRRSGRLPAVEQREILAGIADSMQPDTPPRENRRRQRTVDVVVGAAISRRSACTRTGRART